MDRARFNTVVRECVTAGITSVLEKYGICLFTFYKFLRTNPDAAEEYACAQQARSEAFVDEIITISDTEPDAQRARNRIDARRWYASKMLPGKFGDRIEVNVAATVDIRAALEESRARVLHPRFTQLQPTQQVIDITPQISNRTTDSQSVERDAHAIAIDEMLS